MEEKKLFQFESEETHTLISLNAEVLSIETVESISQGIHQGLMDWPYFVFYSHNRVFSEEKVWSPLLELLEEVEAAGGKLIFVNFSFSAKHKSITHLLYESEDIQEAVDELILSQIDEEMDTWQ